MPSDAQALLLQVSADTSRAVKKLDDLNKKLAGVATNTAVQSKKASTSLDRFFGQGTKGASELGRALGNIKTATLQQLAPGADRYATALGHLGVAGVAAGVAIAGLVAAFAEAREAVRFADDLADTADRLHVTTDALQEYRFAIRAAGGEEKGADEALESFNETIGKAQEGLPKAQKGFLALGFTKAQIDGFTDAETTLPKIAAALEGLSDAQKDAVVSQLGLTGLKQLLESGPEAMDKFLRSAKAAGVVMDSDLIARSKDLNDEIETATRKIDVQLKSAFIALGPVILDAIRLMGGLLEKTVQIIDAFQTIENKRTSHLADLRDDFIARSKTPETFLFGGPAKDRERAARAQAEIDKRAARDKPPPIKPTHTLINTSHGGSKSGPHDSTAQRSSQVEAQVENAQRDVLRALVSLTEDTQARANLQKQILDRETAADLAKTKGEIAAIEADKGLTAAKKAELIAELKAVELGKGIAAGLEKQAIDREAAAAASRQAVELAQQGLDGEAELLRQRQQLATSSSEQQAIALRLVDLAYQREKAELEALIATQKAAGADTRLAELKLAQLNAQQPGRREDAARTGSDAAREATSAIESIRKRGSAAEEHAAVLAEIERQRQGDLAHEEDYARAKAEVNQRYHEQRLSDASSFFGNLATLSESSNKTLHAIGKAAAIAQATIDGILAVQVALRSAPPPFNFALAAAAGVAAAVNVGKIAAMADGGQVRGPGGPRADQVPAMLSNGEFVVKASAAQRNLGLLQAINAGGLPGFAAGGLVGPRLSGGRPVIDVHQAHFHLQSPVVTQDLLDQMQAISARDSSTAYSRARRDTLGEVGRQRYSQDLNS